MGMVLVAFLSFIFLLYAFFSKIGFRFWLFSAPMCIKRLSLGLHCVYSRTKGYSFKSGTSFVELAVKWEN